MWNRILLLVVLVFSFTTLSADTLSSQNRTMAGAYSPIGTADPGVIAAANFAVEQLNAGTLANIVSAESQVVAGINYSLLLQITAADGTMHDYKVVVFAPLQNPDMPVQPMQLISSDDVTGAI